LLFSRDRGLDRGDASSEVAALKSPCRLCIEATNVPGPGCADELAQCLPTRCGGWFECGYDAGCAAQMTAHEALDCWRLCLGPIAGSANDPTVVAISRLAQCIHQRCSDICLTLVSP
jgi:hypothetical protein